MISAVIEHTYWSGTATSLASDLVPAAPLPPPSPPSAVARSSASASASAAAAASVAATSAAAAATAIPRALDAAAARSVSRAATSCTCSAASSLAASVPRPPASPCAPSCCASSSLWHRARASTPTLPSRTSRGAAASAASSVDSQPPAMAARGSAASACSAANTAGSGAAASGKAGADAGGAPLGSSPASAARSAFFFFFLDIFEGACFLACAAASSASLSIAASARGTCDGAACCWVVSAVFVRPCALARREGRCGRRCRAARCRPPTPSRAQLKATVAIAPSTTESTTQGQASGTTVQHRARPRPSERHDACCRMSFAVAVWPWDSAHCRALWLLPSRSSVLASARSRACTHASCPW
eukprot:scaffold75514_cov83-Phaeocystis_antarctica.AAC.2